MNFKDYYKTLEVEKSASQDEIKKSFRKLANKYHPDKNKGDATAESKFKDISEAYDVLSDPEKRSKYDNLGSSYNNFRNTGGTDSDFDWSKWSANNRRKGKTVGDYFNSGGNMSDFFEKIFGNTPKSGGSFNFTDNPEDGEDYKLEVEIGIEDAFKGIKKRLKVLNQSIEVNIKPGVTNDHIMKISGKGYTGKFGGKQGDLIIKIKIADNPKIERINNDIYQIVDIDLYDAVLGIEKTFETISGKFKVKVGKNNQQGKMIKLSKRGMPIYGQEGAAGDLYLKLNIILPENLSEAELELFKKLKEFKK